VEALCRPVNVGLQPSHDETISLAVRLQATALEVSIEFCDPFSVEGRAPAGLNWNQRPSK
jgi:hypothetical protein